VGSDAFEASSPAPERQCVNAKTEQPPARKQLGKKVQAGVAEGEIAHLPRQQYPVPALPSRVCDWPPPN
jgi:hypothetical protein